MSIRRVPVRVPVGLCLALFLLCVAPGSAQRTVPFENGRPVAPTGIAEVPLPAAPVEFDTAEGQRIRVSVVARGLENPWSLAFLPDGRMLVTERAGRLRIIRNGVLDPKPVAGVPEVRVGNIAGLMDVALHPRFAQNRFVYLTYTKGLDEKRSTMALARGEWNGTALTGVRDLFVATEGNFGGARIAFAPDGMLFLTIGGLREGAQDPDSDSGKVLRLRDDGSVPGDNPFVGKAGYRPEIYSLGHRNILGAAIHPATGELWGNEHGPQGGDELNRIRPGANYGWPVVSYGRDYPGPWKTEHVEGAAFERPVVVWQPSIAVSGLAFYTGDRLPLWKGDVFVGAMRVGEVPGTGHLQRIVFNERMEELRRESILTELRQRIRDVRQGPDGLLYLVTDHDTDGAVLKMEPAVKGA